MAKDQFTDNDRLTLEVLEGKVYQLEMQAQSSRCTAGFKIGHMPAKVCVLERGHDGEHLHAAGAYTSNVTRWSA